MPKKINIHFGVVAAWNHSRIPTVTPVSAIGHSPPSTAYSLHSVSCSQSAAGRTLFFASLYTCIGKIIIRFQFSYSQETSSPNQYKPKIISSISGETNLRTSTESRPYSNKLKLKLEYRKKKTAKPSPSPTLDSSTHIVNMFYPSSQK